MGNHQKGMSSLETPISRTYEPVETFQFHDAFPEDSNNGLYLNDVYVPEEVITMILSYVDSQHILKCSEVCKKWCNIIKSHAFWAHIYHQRYRKKPKKLPWYVYYCFLTTNYFDTNLIKNGNGQERFNHWKIVLNYGDEFQIEDPPSGANPLPPDVPDFNGKTSCFATSYYECNKLQEISFENSRLMQLIFNRYKPLIVVSEWVAGRFDCGCIYNLWVKFYGHHSAPIAKKRERQGDFSGLSSDEDSQSDNEDDEVALHVEQTGMRVEQWAGSEWSKVQLLIKNYPKGVQRIVFQHEGRDTQFWKGHYGSKMAGGVLKIMFDSIVEDCDN